MTPLNKALCVSLVLFGAGSAPLHGQWNRLNGPYGGPVGSLAVSRSDLFAGVLGSNEIYRSSDGGASWMELDSGLPAGTLVSLAAVDSNIFASMDSYPLPGTWDSLYRSIDRGKSWNAVATGWRNAYIQGLLADGSRLYALAAGVNWSSDAGAHWTSANTGLTDSTDVVSISAVDTELFVGTVTHLYRSTNSARSWFRADSGLPRAWINCVRPQNSKLFAGTMFGLFVSSDRGNSWGPVNDPNLGSGEIGWMALSGNTILAGRYSEMYRSADGGATWSKVTSGLPEGLSSASVHAVASLGGRLYAGIDPDGVYISSDDGASWSEANHGICMPLIQSLAYSGSSILAGAQNGLFRSTDGGATWSRSGSGMADSSIQCLAVSAGRVFAGTLGGIFLSTNDGAVWSPVGINLARPPITALGVQGSTVIAGFNGGAFISRDAGANWDSVRSQLRGKTPYCFAATTDVLFAATSPFGLYYSNDGGLAWIWENTGLGKDETLTLAVVNGAVLMGTDTGILRSLDDGNTWSQLGGTIGEYFEEIVGTGNDLFASASFSGILSSGDQGAHWSDANAGLRYLQIQALALVGNNLFCSTAPGGLWRRPVSEMITSAARSMQSSSRQFLLEQNYPNPFNPTTTIRYALPQRSHVTLAVFNPLGQLVTTLVSGEEAAGDHIVNLDGVNLASGIYIYRLQAGSYVQTRKLLLLK